MATVAVSPNRMELLRMKKKQQFAQRGHKLLKDKLEGLLKDFTGIVQDYAVLRSQVDSELGELFQQFIVASASMPAEVYRSALAFPECEAELTMTEKLIMNVRVPVFSFAIEGNLLSYGTDGTVVELDQAIVKLKEVLERLVKLAEAEKTIELVADEIEKTRRRVNALEYVLIPQQGRDHPHDLLQAGGAGARQHHPPHAHQATPRHVAFSGRELSTSRASRTCARQLSEAEKISTSVTKARNTPRRPHETPILIEPLLELIGDFVHGLQRLAGRARHRAHHQLDGLALDRTAGLLPLPRRVHHGHPGPEARRDGIGQELVPLSVAHRATAAVTQAEEQPELDARFEPVGTRRMRRRGRGRQHRRSGHDQQEAQRPHPSDGSSPFCTEAGADSKRRSTCHLHHTTYGKRLHTSLAAAEPRIEWRIIAFDVMELLRAGIRSGGLPEDGRVRRRLRGTAGIVRDQSEAAAQASPTPRTSCPERRPVECPSSFPNCPDSGQFVVDRADWSYLSRSEGKA